MIKSMTGYGKEVIQLGKQTITVEMRSVNHRFLDIVVKMPGQLMLLEETFKKTIKRFFERGKIEVYIRISGEGGIHKNLQIDWNLLEQYIESVDQMKEKFKVDGNIPVSAFLTLPDIYEVQEVEETDVELKEALTHAVEKASTELLTMRKTEGEFLKKDILERLDKINRLMDEIEKLQPVIIQEYKERILDRIHEHLEGVSGIDEARIHQEVAILSEKGDITEEVVRLKSHIEHMNKTLNEKGSIGRKLDFICQEMNREANTIGSKSTDKRLSEYDVLLKSEIEKIKEQVQNIE